MSPVYRVCNAHLDPVWPQEWLQGAAEALSTFRAAMELCASFGELAFDHNEALLYRRVGLDGSRISAHRVECHYNSRVKTRAFFLFSRGQRPAVDGELRLSLLRSPAYAAHPFRGAPQGRPALHPSIRPGRARLSLLDQRR